MYTQVTNDYSNDVNSHFIDNIELIPDESIKGCHIHKLHKVPTINDDVPWLSVFNKIINLNNDLILNLEVLSSLQSVLETKKFSIEMINEAKKRKEKTVI